MTERVPFNRAVLDVTGGNSRLLTSEYETEGAIPVIDQGQALIAGFTDDRSAICAREGVVILFGDHTRTFKYVDFDFALGADGVKVLQPREGFDPRYLFHYLRTVPLPANLGYSRHFKFLRECTVPKPTLDEQKRIASVFDKAESLRRRRKDAIQLVDKFLRAVFDQMFGDPVTNSKRLPTMRIDTLCDVATGATPSRDRADYYRGPHPWIKTGEVDNPCINSAEEHISEAALEETNCKLFPKRTLLVAMYGQGKTRGKVGMLGIPAATNQACAAILPSDAIDPHFLYEQLRVMYEHLRGMARGGNQENLNLGMIKSLEVLVPPRDQVQRFLEIRCRAQSTFDKARLAAEETERLTASLQSMLLT
jgi:type I restriction enzyme S subunit